MKNLKRVYVLPRKMAENGLSTILGNVGPYALVSICDNGFEAVVPAGDTVTDTLRLCFVDWDADRGDPAMLDHEVFGKKVGDWLVQPAHAQALAEFLGKNADAETLVIHCYAGISRSVSTAMAVVDAFRYSRAILAIATGRREFGPPPNQMVYSVMYSTLREARVAG